jgi:uncharacterized protein YneF (UPF0154 family)
MIDRFHLLYDSGVGKDILSKNPNLTTEHIDLLYNASVKQNPLRYAQLEVIENLGRYPKLTEEQFMRYYNEADFLDLKYLSRNPHLTTEQIDLLYETEGASKNKLSQWPKLTEEQFMRFFKDKDVKKPLLSYNSNLTTEQIDLLYDYGNDVGDRLNPNDDVRRFLVQKSKLTDEQFMRFFNDKSLENTKLAKNPHLTPEQIDLLYKTREEDIMENLARYPKLTEEQFMRFFNEHYKNLLAQNRNLTPKQIDLLYWVLGNLSGNVNVKANLARYSKLSEEQFMRLFNDDDYLENKHRYKNQLAMNPSINPLPNRQFASGIFNWRW